ncbi:protein phosphatase 1 regulatory subunit 14C-like [Zerene cesonia]|uniref:protein phosphatase 1 regulatory subunit 14C-like n=1 Tax=Zerene cesonia TaxID=33412 RepID=UPI0018E4E508|nr:protein phosphatase 1 regulatory subunit 14C-like [Zerene cesonia]
MRFIALEEVQWHQVYSSESQYNEGPIGISNRLYGKGSARVAASCVRRARQCARGRGDTCPHLPLMSLFFKFRSGRSSGGGAMECGVAAASAAGAFPARGHPPHPAHHAHAAHPAHPALSPTERSPAKAGLHVNFSDKGEVKERREKFLTAKYGSHQMALIRKRLAVEMWLYDELQKLYESPSEAAAGAGSAAGGGSGGSADQEVEVDIDELLDMDSDDQRRRHLTVLLADAKKPQKDVYKFINDLLEKAKTL